VLDGSEKDGQSVTADWALAQEPIDGVRIQEIRSVLTGSGYVTEIFRRDWELGDGTVDQVFQTTLSPGAVSAWHCHVNTTDRLMVNVGRMRIVLYDAREGSPTAGRLTHHLFGTPRPALVVVPPLVWHGVQNIGPGDAALINVVDAAYDYEDPDHWRLPADSPEIPYRFPSPA
jgi:dTDP-4-dehydrorhamnose 3,5-epimerase